MSEKGTTANIGIVSDCALQRHMLSQALHKYDLNVLISCGPELLSQQEENRIQTVSCWIVALKDEDQEFPEIDKIFEEAERTPVLFGLESAPAKNEEPYISWERRLFSKLTEFIGPLEEFDSEDSLLSLQQSGQYESFLANDFIPPSKRKAEEVWVLAASLGGPAAVKSFLDLLPASIKAGFYYAQHIDVQNSQVLTKVLGRHSKLELVPAQHGDSLKHGDVVVVPVDKEISFENNLINFKNNEWEGPYGPSIDHLLRNLFHQYGKKCHVIIFSGMGNDGALMAPKLRQAGSEVWVQTPSSCANGSMPESVMDLACHTRSGTPEELARHFIKQVGCYTPNDF